VVLGEDSVCQHVGGALVGPSFRSALKSLLPVAWLLAVERQPNSNTNLLEIFDLVIEIYTFLPQTLRFSCHPRNYTSVSCVCEE